MNYISLLISEHKDCTMNWTGLPREEVLIAGINCQQILCEIMAHISGNVSRLDDKEIIGMIEQKYKLSSSTKEHLQEVISIDTIAGIYDGVSVPHFYVKTLPLEIFEFEVGMN